MPNDPDYALVLLISSFFFNGVGLLVALMILVMYLQRLAIHKARRPAKATRLTVAEPPSRGDHLDVCVQLARDVSLTFAVLPLGPCGQGGFALVKGGDVARQLFPLLAARDPTNERIVILAELGNAFYASGIVFGLLLFGLAFFFTVIALCACGTTALR